MGQQGRYLDSSLNNSSDNSLAIRLGSSINNSLFNRIGNRLAISSTLVRVRKTTEGVELRLSLNQQVGDTRRRVTEEASRKAKVTAQRQSNLSHSSPSGRMRRTSKYRPKKRPRETRTCTGI